jgi:WD40 repeat protein
MALWRVSAVTPRIKGKNLCFDAAGASLFYSAGALVVCESVADRIQHFLTGHTAPVSALALASTGLLASGQEGPLPLIRFWDTHSLPLPVPRVDMHQDPSLFHERLTQLYTRKQQLLRAYRTLRAAHAELGSEAAYEAVMRSAACVLGANSLTKDKTCDAAAAAVRALAAQGHAVCIGSVVADVKTLSIIAFGPCTHRNNMLMAVVGADEHNRPIICVYDIAPLITRSSASPADAVAAAEAAPVLIARQVSEFPIHRLRFHPAPSDTCVLVSCGQSNIRFWRIKQGHLPAASVALGEHSRQNFLDFDFEAYYGEDDRTPKRLFASTASGALYQVSLTDRRLECVYQLHNGPIYTVSVNEGFCVTGSADGYLRVWPLDFSDYYLQALHPAPVVCCALSSDGLRVAAVTESGAVGTMDLATSAYSTLLRSHTGPIVAAAVAQTLPQVATASTDGTIRVWSVRGMEQLYEFQCSETEVCTAMLFHDHSTALAQGVYRLVCGFSSGVIRVVDVASTTTVVKLKQHAGPVTQLLLSPDGNWVYSLGYDGKLCIYDVNKHYQPARTCDTAALSSIYDANALAAAKASPHPNTTAAPGAARIPVAGIRPAARIPAPVLAGVKSSFYPATSPAMAAAVNAPTPAIFPGALAVASSAVVNGVPTTEQQLQLAPSMALSADGSLVAVTGEDAHSVMLLDAMRLTEIFRLNVGSRAVVKLVFDTYQEPACCSRKHAAAPAAEELFVFFSDAAFARYSIPDCTLLATSVPKTIPRAVPAPLDADRPAPASGLSVLAAGVGAGLDPRELQKMLVAHTNRAKKGLSNATISQPQQHGLTTSAATISLSTAQTALARDFDWLTEVFTAAAHFKLCHQALVVGRWVIIASTSGAHGALQVWSRDGRQAGGSVANGGGVSLSQSFTGPQPFTSALVHIPERHFASATASSSCHCDCRTCMHLHNPADTQALLGAEQADKGLLSTEIQLSRGTQAVMAVGGNAMFMYLVGVGAAEAEARREKVIMSQYEAIVNMKEAEASNDGFTDASGPSSGGHVTAAQRLRAKVDAAVLHTARQQASAAHLAGTSAAQQGLVRDGQIMASQANF